MSRFPRRIVDHIQRRWTRARARRKPQTKIEQSSRVETAGWPRYASQGARPSTSARQGQTLCFCHSPPESRPRPSCRSSRTRSRAAEQQLAIGCLCRAKPASSIARLFISAVETSASAAALDRIADYIASATPMGWLDKVPGAGDLYIGGLVSCCHSLVAWRLVELTLFTCQVYLRCVVAMPSRKPVPHMSSLCYAGTSTSSLCDPTSTSRSTSTMKTKKT